MSVLLSKPQYQAVFTHQRTTHHQNGERRAANGERRTANGVRTKNNERTELHKCLALQSFRFFLSVYRTDGTGLRLDKHSYLAM
jgi:hypothetical protein